MSNFEEIAFDKGVNISRPKVLLEKNEMYVCEGFDLEYIGILRGRDPRGEVMEVTGPYPDHSVVPYYPPVVPELYPQAPYLIGWYKFNEGSGTVVANSATDGSGGGGLLPDLAIIQNDGVFWTFNSGFGSTEGMGFGAGDGLNDFAWANSGRTIGGANKSCFGIFVRAKASGYPSGSGGLLLSTLSGSGAGSTPGIHITNEGEGARQGVRFGTDTSAWTPGTAENLGRWHFHFINNLGQWWVVRPEGDRLLAMSGISLTQTLNFEWMFSGCWYADADPPTKGYYPGGGSYADWIIYNQTVLTDTQWAEWYDDQRSRYGMAARSGW